jgi:hypothetical protein
MSATISSLRPKPIPVTPDNFVRAESDMYFGHVVKDGGFGKFHHNREPMPIDAQTVIRANRDTLYSGAVFDLEAGPVTVKLPDPGKRFLSLQAFDEDEYVLGVAYGAGTHSYTRQKVGTRYLLLATRILVNPDDPEDVKKVRTLQDSIWVEQDRPGRFEVPPWDGESQKTVREALLALGRTLADTRHMFGGKSEVDPVRHLIGAAMAWGGNPEKDALYLNVTPERNDGKTAYWLHAKDVPVDGFWSVIVYDAKGYIPKNGRGVYSFNNLTAKKDADGSVTIQFGGDPDKAQNRIPIVPGWNYMVRLYRPRREILDGSWRFPVAQPIQ